MRFTVETWDASYGTPIEGTELDPATEPIDPNVEIDAGAWAPRRPATGTEPPEEVWFLDGVRRIDARVWIATDGDGVRPGVCASVAAGAVRCTPTGARVVDARVRRGLVCTAPAAAPIVTRHGSYEVLPVTDDSPEGLYLGVHERMIALEEELSAAVSGSLVVVDGPLRGRSAPAQLAGYVKTHHVAYLPPDLQSVVARLAVGERTPLFLIGGRFTRWSWYVRLPGPRSHPLSGVVRAELPGLGTVEQATERADLVTATLPRFASEPHKDGRAPQNLYPIAGLERELRRRLGDALLLERALRQAAAVAA